jgi:subtilisin family serine protease
MLTGSTAAALVAASAASAQSTTDTTAAATESVDDITTPIAPLYGNIDPFYGTISPFYGTINPFYGDISAFWGTINPFYGNIISFWGSINPFYGNIGAFQADVGQYWEGFGTYWNETAPLWDDPLKAAELGLKLTDMVTRTELVWGAAVYKATGKTFAQAVAQPLFARYGIDPNDPRTLQALSSETRARFFVDWYDSLMAHSGTDRVDHWMRSVNWTPSITQQQGSGADSIIGLLDATASGDPDIADNLTYSGGGTATVGGHGVGVASLMVSAHDGAGVMGIAPNARVVAFNPFDSTNTASFKAARDGIVALANHGASVINMSLGVSGYTLHPDWRKVFSDSQVYEGTAGKVAFVMAAGNDGTAQSENIQWDYSRAPALLLVGSADVNGVISTFSNRPGSACLLNGTQCQDRLMDFFLVAPGELILLPDGNGGFVRRSGTSFAAPLVSGAITLLHDRWPWLAKYPKETVNIILDSARDLGDPGTDPVYGRGMLDVAASQSPLNFNALRFYEVKNGVQTEVSAANVQAGGLKTSWEADGVYFHLFETIGNTHRDFSVPLSSALVGQVTTLGGSSEYFQRFIEQRLKDWIKGSAGFSDVATITSPAGAGWQASVSASLNASTFDQQGSIELPHSSIRFANDSGFAFTAGTGEGGLALNQVEGLGLTSDYGRNGGVNPLLALASGGSFASFEVPLARSTSVSIGVTSHDNMRAEYRSPAERYHYQGVDAFKAAAINVRLAHKVSEAVRLSFSYARVGEANGLLGVQSRFKADLGHGAVSDTFTMAGSAQLGSGLTLALSATGGRTRSGTDAEQGIATAGDGVLTSSLALAATKQGLFGSGDMVRLSIAQPLHIESGELTYKSVQVVDRATGELGLVEQSFEVAGAPRPYAGELLYASPVGGGAGEVGLFGRAELNNREAGGDVLTAGARMNLRF